VLLQSASVVLDERRFGADLVGRSLHLEAKEYANREFFHLLLWLRFARLAASRCTVVLAARKRLRVGRGADDKVCLFDLGDSFRSVRSCVLSLLLCACGFCYFQYLQMCCCGSEGVCWRGSSVLRVVGFKSGQSRRRYRS
jgi:hypothetical protein